MTDWIEALQALAAKSESSVLITVAGIRGSAPRETGAKMIVTTTETIGSIGGGQLEYQCARQAADHLRGGDRDSREISSRRFSLGANCGQCCGGVVEVIFEYLPGSGAGWLDELQRWHAERQPLVMATSVNGAKEKLLVTPDGQDPACPAAVVGAAQAMLSSVEPACVIDGWLLEPVRPGDFHIAVFGAGHVGAATVDVLARLDCSVRWIDNRRGIFPATVPANVTLVEAAEPAREVAASPAGAYYLVMTHSHPLDLDICDQALRRQDAAYCGVIGSVSKRRRFRRLLKNQGLSPATIEKLVCPVGVAGINSKQPVEIALAVAAEVLQTRDLKTNKNLKQDYLKVTG